MSEIILDMWLYTHHKFALLAKKSDSTNKVSPILLPLQTLHIKSTSVYYYFTSRSGYGLDKIMWIYN